MKPSCNTPCQGTYRQKSVFCNLFLDRYSLIHPHSKLIEQQEHLSRVIRGHCVYYGITGNMKRLSMFRYQLIRGWCKALSRRSRDGYLNWGKMSILISQYPLARARVVRSIYAT
ncbi:MAG: hypothetical protein OXF60_02210 [Gammaproteobacteria bacterium]|nr:hypothetical protein [Gammaproteobacteria bacterium]